MRTAFLTGLLFVLAGFAPPAASPGDRTAFADNRKSVAVLYFDNNSGDARYDAFGKALADMMITDLSAVETIRLVEREHLQRLIEELELQQSDYFDPATAQQVGRFVGAEYVVTGALTALEPDIRIDTRVIRVETSEVVKTAQVSGREKKFFDLQQKLADALIDGLDVALSPEALEQLRARQEANRIEELETARDYAQALDLFDREDYLGALEKMHGVARSAPNSTLVQLTYDRIKDKAEREAKRKIRNKVGGFLKKQLQD